MFRQPSSVHRTQMDRKHSTTVLMGPPAPRSKPVAEPMLDTPSPMESPPITEDDAWTVISSYFEEKGLVRQQLDSFDEFVHNTMQEVINEAMPIELFPERQTKESKRYKFQFRFGQMFLSAPSMIEPGGSDPKVMF